MALDVLSIVDAIVSDLFPSQPSASLTWQRLRSRGDKQWYQSYLRSHHWRRFRKKILADCGYRCQQCGTIDPNKDERRGTRLHIHHKTYDRVGHEHLSDVEALCRICHRREHGNG